MEYYLNIKRLKEAYSKKQKEYSNPSVGTYRSMARRIGITYHSLHRFVNSDDTELVSCSMNCYFKLVEFFKVHPDYFLTIKKSK